jgi:hypothetical protein
MSRPSDLCANPRNTPFAKWLSEISHKEAETAILVSSIGTLIGLKNEIVTLGAAEQLVFNLDVLLYCRSAGMARFVGLLEEAMELDDIRGQVGEEEFLDAANSILKRIVETARAPGDACSP